MLCACSSRSALHFDLGVEQACSAAARVLLASPSRTPPSSCSSSLAFLLYEASPHAEVRRLRIHVSCGSALPSSGFYVILLEIAYARVLPVRGRTDVFSRPRRQVSSSIALHMSSLLPGCSAEPLSILVARCFFLAATAYNFESTAA